jgi:GrpB-like predicted nucleotidyltransferase (UPF0157 family)
VQVLRAKNVERVKSEWNAAPEAIAAAAEWPSLFTRLAKQIREALGDAILLLEHVGSTSVPGLSAKPIIDMVLAVVDSEDWWYPGGPGKDSEFFQTARWEHPYFQATFVDRAILDGFLDRETVDKAHEEMAQWTQDPRAFHFHPLVFVAGRA